MSQANLLLYIDEPIEGNELAGEPTGGFERTARRAWFEVETIGGTEYQLSQQTQSQTSHRMKCAYFAGAHSRMRLSRGEVAAPSRVFHVESVVDEHEEHRFLVWMVKEVV